MKRELDYAKAEEIMNVVMNFVYGYMVDYPDAFEDDTGMHISADDIEASYNKVKNG